MSNIVKGKELKDLTVTENKLSEELQNKINSGGNGGDYLPLSGGTMTGGIDFHGGGELYGDGSGTFTVNNREGDIIFNSTRADVKINASGNITLDVSNGKATYNGSEIATVNGIPGLTHYLPLAGNSPETPVTGNVYFQSGTYSSHARLNFYQVNGEQQEFAGEIYSDILHTPTGEFIPGMVFHSHNQLILMSGHSSGHDNKIFYYKGGAPVIPRFDQELAVVGDIITVKDGDGTKFLADDGTYKEVSPEIPDTSRYVLNSTSQDVNTTCDILYPYVSISHCESLFLESRKIQVLSSGVLELNGEETLILHAADLRFQNIFDSHEIDEPITAVMVMTDSGKAARITLEKFRELLEI